MRPRDSPILIASVPRATIRRFGLRRELYIVIILLGAVVVQAGLIAIAVSSWPANEFAWFPRNYVLWKRGDLDHANGRSTIIRRPLWCGALYLALPADRVTDIHHAYDAKSILNSGIMYLAYDRKGIALDESPPPGRRLEGVLVNGVVTSQWITLDTWHAEVYPVIPSGDVPLIDVPLLRSAITSGDEYTELLAVGWPWRVATLGTSCHLTGPNGRSNFAMRGAHVSMPVGKRSPHSPNELLNLYPLEFRYPALIASLLLWGACIATAMLTLLAIASLVCRWRGRCPACAYRLSSDQNRCPECGLAVRRGSITT